jgi:hypothetical protein
MMKPLRGASYSSELCVLVVAHWHHSNACVRCGRERIDFMLLINDRPRPAGQRASPEIAATPENLLTAEMPLGHVKRFWTFVMGAVADPDLQRSCVLR